MGGYVAKVIATTPSCNGGIGADDITGEIAIVRKNGVTRNLDGALYRYGLVTSSGSSVSHSSDKETSANSSRSPSTSSSVVSNIDHGEYTPKIKELTEAVKQAAEQKQLNTQRMVAAVNEVKKLEVELDRAGQNLSQVQQRHSEQDATVTMLRSRLKKVREQLAIAREAERQRNQN
nr:Protein F54H5.3 [Haemonchus contortus]